jgi:DNA polymerase III epsilon subunit-like protein
MYLFFDTETTGLPRNWQAPLIELDNWPRMVQLAWLYYDERGRKIAEQNYIIRPQGFTIPQAATNVHGISTERAYQEGVPLALALKEFSALLNQSRFLVAHNLNFDEKIIGAEFLRARVPIASKNIKKICTMKLATDYCQIPSNNGYKWPSLSELHQKLFAKDFEDAHDALVDVKACADCFFEMKRRGLIG